MRKKFVINCSGVIHCCNSFWDLRRSQIWIHLPCALLLCTANWELCRAKSKISQKPNFHRSLTFSDLTCYLTTDDIVIIGHYLFFIGCHSLKTWLFLLLKSLLRFSLFCLELSGLVLSVWSCEPFLEAAYRHYSPFLWNIPVFSIFRNKWDRSQKKKMLLGFWVKVNITPGVKLF